MMGAVIQSIILDIRLRRQIILREKDSDKTSFGYEEKERESERESVILWLLLSSFCLWHMTKVMYICVSIYIYKDKMP